MHPLFQLFLCSKLHMARGKGKNCPKSKILEVLKSAHQNFSENALSKFKNPFCEIYYIKPDTLPPSLIPSSNSVLPIAWITAWATDDRHDNYLLGLLSML